MTLNCYPDVDNLLFDLPLKQALSLSDDIMALNVAVSVDVLKLSFRPAKRLNKGKILTIQQLLALTLEELFDMRGMGYRSIEEIVKHLLQFFRKAETVAASCGLIVASSDRVSVAAAQHDWFPLSLREDWETFSNGEPPPMLSLSVLALQSELIEALSSAQCEQIDALLDWTWERAERELGENAAEEISDALLTFAQSLRIVGETEHLRQPLSPESRQEIIETRWAGCLIATCGFQLRTRSVLEAAEIMNFRQLVDALSPLCPALCLDLLAFEDVWNRLVAWGMRQGSAQSVWDRLVTPDKCDVNLDAVAAEVHHALSEKHWKVLDLRYGLLRHTMDGLGGQNGRTLEEVAQISCLTRERVRQIELAAFNTLQKADVTFLHSLTATLGRFMEAAGGLLSVKDVAQKVTAHIPAGGVNAEALCRLLFDIHEDVVAVRRGSVYCHSSFPISVYPLVLRTAGRLVKESLTVLSIGELGEHVHDKLKMEGFSIDPSIVVACLRADGRFSSDFKRSDLNFHLAHILRQIGHPAHFTEITAQLNTSGWRRNSTSERSVNSRLGSERDLFVYVGVGTYGLAEWGSEDKRVYERFKNGYIGDVIEEFLTARDEPASTSEIIAFVLSRKRCQDFSILQRLSNDDRFHAFARGRYGLKKWVM